mgnify:FL=1
MEECENIKDGACTVECECEDKDAEEIWIPLTELEKYLTNIQSMLTHIVGGITNSVEYIKNNAVAKEGDSDDGN